MSETSQNPTASPLADFLNHHYPGGPFELQEALETKGERRACRVRSSADIIYVVKISAPGRAEALVQADVGALASLAQRGFPVPRPAPCADGRLLLPFGEEQFIYLYEYLPGHSPRPRLDFYHRLGRLLARLHSLPIDPGLPRSTYQPDAILDEARRLLAGVTAAEQRGVLPEVLGIIDRFPTFDGLPQGMIHSDPYFGNLLENEQHELYLIDWDDGGVAYPLMDVGYVLAHLCSFTARDRRLLGIEEDGTGPEEAVSWRPDWARAFLAAYDSLRPLSAVERAHLPDAIRLAFIAYLYDWDTGSLILDNYRRMKLLDGQFG